MIHLYKCIQNSTQIVSEVKREKNMTISYEKLWQLLKKNKMKKKDLAAAASVSEYTMAKLRHGETVSMDVMVRFCKIFHCDIGDLMEINESD